MQIHDIDQNRFFLHGLIKYWIDYMISGIHTYVLNIYLSQKSTGQIIFLFYHGV
jgi:hypothetical protein